MRIISAQPDHIYMIWQLYVQINNFTKLSIADKYIILIGYRNNTISKESIEFKKHCDIHKVICLFYPDKREEVPYLPSIKPHLLKQYFKYNPQKEPFLLIDSDVIFTTKFPNLEECYSDEVWYLSDTIDYIGAAYIISKGEELLEKMCKLVGIDKQIVIDNEGYSGGAQYLIKNSNYNFWKKVEKDSVSLYSLMKETEQIYCPEHPIQSWCAEMWATLWNCWLHGIQTDVIKELDFCWPMNDIKEYQEKYIYHNAGVIDEDKDLFYKGKYTQNYPFNDNFDHINKEKCTIEYTKEVMETGKKLGLHDSRNGEMSL